MINLKDALKDYLKENNLEKVNIYYSDINGGAYVKEVAFEKINEFIESLYKAKSKILKIESR